jgi:hypothetical protein
MTTHINMLQMPEDEGFDHSPNLGLIRIDSNETAVIPFTPDAVQVGLHYCDLPEIRGYVRCNGPKCVLCLAGRKAEERILLPVYSPASQAIGVLSFSTSSRPGALRPQLLPALRSGKRVAVLIRKADQYKHVVSVRDLDEDMDDGARLITAFLERFEAREDDLASVYPRHDNRYLASFPAIASILRLKGIQDDELD